MAKKSENLASARKSIIMLTMTCKAACASINSVLDDEFEYNDSTLTVRQWMDLMGYKWGKKGLTPDALFSVWHKEMKLENGDVCLWQRVPAKVITTDEDGKEIQKTVYEWDDKKKCHKVVGERKLVKVEKWTPALVINALIASWNYAKELNTNAKNHEHIESIKHFYVNAKSSATRKGYKSEMAEVKRDAITF